jgi:hypothetical protein
MQDNQEKEPRTDDVQTQYKKTKKNPAEGMGVCLLFVLCCASSGLCD